MWTKKSTIDKVKEIWHFWTDIEPHRCVTEPPLSAHFIDEDRLSPTRLRDLFD
ncbi:hypothetical protein SAMN02787142_3740 [Burkholderia sp. WP9]|nr:hypothetical protein SAMN02787142_3740 [Burkholderia sp. WP9]